MQRTFKMATCALIALAVLSFVPRAAIATYKVSGTINSVYSLSGSYYLENGDLRIISEKLSVDIDTSGPVAQVTFNYYIAELPYGISDEAFIASIEEMSSMTKMGSALSHGSASNPFEVFYGANTVDTEITTEGLVLSLRWNDCTGILLSCEAKVQGEAQRILYIKYYSSTADIYGCFDDSTRKNIEMTKFIVSPVGLFSIALPVILFTILIFYIAKTKQKVKTRKGRVPTAVKQP